MTIPARLHFCWIGTRLSWVSVFAVLSAAGRGGIGDIVLHHTDALDDGPELRMVASAPGVRLCRLDGGTLLGRTGQILGLGDALVRLYAALERPVMRADLLRAAILYLEGGVYLDLDTVTVASLLPLLDVEIFLGTESIVWPERVRRSRSPAVWARHLTLDVVRKMFTALPHGWRFFRRLEFLYASSVNNAVMGAVRQSSFFADMLREMASVRLDTASRTALGPALLQKMVAQHAGGGLVIHPPPVFYPLAPEISRHWFRFSARPRLDQVLSAETRVVHWYASVRNAGLARTITPDSVRRDRRRQLYSALVCASIDTLSPFSQRSNLQEGPDLRTERISPSRLSRSLHEMRHRCGRAGCPAARQSRAEAACASAGHGADRTRDVACASGGHC